MAANTLRVHYPIGTNRLFCEFNGFPQIFKGSISAKIEPFGPDGDFTLFDVIQGPSSQIGKDYALGAGGITYGSYNHALPQGAPTANGPVPPYQSFLWFGVRDGKPQAHFFDARYPSGQETGNVPYEYFLRVGTGADVVVTAPSQLTLGVCTTVQFRWDWNTPGSTGLIEILIGGVVVASEVLPTQNTSAEFMLDYPSTAVGASKDAGYCTNNVAFAIQECYVYSVPLSTAALVWLDANDGPGSTGPARIFQFDGAADWRNRTSTPFVQEGAINELEACGGGAPPEPPDPDPPPEPPPEPEPTPVPPPTVTPSPPPPTSSPSAPGAPSRTNPSNCCTVGTGPTDASGGAIGGGGSGHSGTNEGGRGWVPFCTDDGDVNVYPDSDPGESMVGVRDPLIHCEIQFRTFTGKTDIVGTAAPEFWGFKTTIPDKPAAYGGKKLGRAKGIGRIKISNSNEQGDLVGGSVSVVLNDRDRAALRARLGSASERFIYDREASLYVVSETGRQNDVVRRNIFRGFTVKSSLSRNMMGALEIQDMITADVGRFGPDKNIGASRTLSPTIWKGVPSELAHKPQQWIVGESSDSGATYPGSGLPAEKGLIPTWVVGTRVLTNGSRYVELHLAAHAIPVGSLRLYGTDGAAEFPQRTALDLTALGTSQDILTPDAPNWPFATRYLDMPDSETGEDHRVTQFFVKEGSIWADAHLSGTINIAANACGMEEVGDGSGRPIRGYFKAMQHCYENLLLPKREYFSGEWPGAGSYSDGVRMVRSTSFDAGQLWSIGRIGGIGYVAGGVLFGPAGGFISNREFVRRWNISAYVKTAWTRSGQCMVTWIDDVKDFENTPSLREPRDIREPILPIEAPEEVENPVLFQYDWDEDKQRFRTDLQRLFDPIAFARSRPRQSPTPIELRYTNHEGTARDAMARRHFMRKYPPVYLPVSMPIDGLDLEVGEYRKVNSYDGYGESGTVENPAFIDSTEYDPETKRVYVFMRDLKREQGFRWRFKNPGDAGVMKFKNSGDADVVTLR